MEQQMSVRTIYQNKKIIKNKNKETGGKNKKIKKDVEV